VRKAIAEGLAATGGNSGMILNFALNYGARMEIVRAVRALLIDVQQGKIKPAVSDFLLWQLAYSELWFSPVYWPDFGRIHLLQAIRDFQQRERRFGKISPE